jgi:tetratricopeptide (TPR) repeat protein
MYKDIGQFLQEASQFDAAIHYFKKALAQAEQMTGPGSNIVAIACHAIAFAYALTKNYRAALDYEKRNFAICQQVYGASAQRTVESNMCLSRWTKDAVDVEVKQRKEVKPASGAAAKKAGKDASGNVGHLPINEVLQFINTPSRKAGGKIAGRVGVSKAKRVGSTPAPAATTAAAKPASETKKTTAAKKAGNAAANNGKANGKSQQPVQKKADPSNDAVPPLI